MARLRRPIIVWWVLWVLSTAVSVFAIATSFTTDAQGIADNTVATIVAYLIALAALVLVGRVLLGFERRPVDQTRQAVGDRRRRQIWRRETRRVPVESEGQNPAA